ncbi:MAG: hypothetical protein HY299_16250 [Verrucomicrobia bacterium]|nr:hypothetical protein [Verrucomicrobiota bacterium]
MKHIVSTAQEKRPGCMGMATIVALSLVAATPAIADVTKSYSTGNNWLGADLALSYVDWASGGNTYQAKFAGDLTGTVIKKKVPLVNGNSSLTIMESSKGVNNNATGSLKLAGYTVANWNKSFGAVSYDFSTSPLFSISYGGEVDYPIGWFALRLSGKAEIKGYAKGNVAATYHPTSRKFSFHGSLGPACDVGASAAASISAWVAEVGVEGSITLISASLLGSVDYTPRTAGNPVVAYALVVQGQNPSGSIKVFEKVGRGWFSHTWKQTLVDFPGATWTIPVTSGTRQL